jgi:hypothetical protein
VRRTTIAPTLRAFLCGVAAGFAMWVVPVAALLAWLGGEAHPWRAAWSRGPGFWLEASSGERTGREGESK